MARKKWQLSNRNHWQLCYGFSGNLFPDCLATFLRNPHQEQRIIKHKQFMQANWLLLAAFAWEYYQQQGRGAVVVDENDFVHADVPQFAALKFRYVADNSTMLKDIGGWPGAKEANWVKTCDPTQRIVVMIVREGGGTSGYMIGGNPPPAECFERQQAKKN